jgi:H/ACA ribonucleoprotein complex non-core subunit NAF1
MNTSNSAILDTPKDVDAKTENGDQTSLLEDANMITQAAEAALQNTTMDAPPSPQITHALEALLSGLDPPKNTSGDIPIVTNAPTVEATKLDAPAPTNESHSAEDSAPVQEDHEFKESKIEDPEEQNAPNKSNPPTEEAPQEPLLVTQSHTAAEAVPTTTENTDVPMGEGAPGEQEHPEWEIDSSPIESSSDDSSDDSSSDESEEGDNAYKLLSPEEQARILMEGDGGSDDEGGAKAKGSGGQLRTKNEVPEVVIPKPDITITPEMPIQEFGKVQTIVDNILLVKAYTSGEYRVLESGSVLCLEDRSVFGVVAETLGRVHQPLYSVLFTNAGEITAAGLAVGTKVFYSEQHSTYVFTQALKAFKGSDASNLHDEEVGDDEMEYSDDEAEMEHKRRVKQQKIERRGGKMQQSGGSSRGGHPSQQHHDASSVMNYDDNEDGPYKPLARPAGYAVGHGEAPQEGVPGSMQNRDHFRGRGRGDWGRGRGDRGRGRGGHQDRRGGSNGYSRPPQGPPSSSHQGPGGSYSQPQGQPQGNGFHAPQMPANAPPPNFYNMSQEYSPHQPQLPAWPQFPPRPPFQQPYQQSFPGMPNGWPNMASAPPLPSGAFINPAFFGNNQPGNTNQWNQNQPGQQGGRGSGGS